MAEDEKPQERSDIQKTIFKKPEGHEIISVTVKLKDEEGNVYEKQIDYNFGKHPAQEASRLIHMTEPDFQITSQRIYQDSNLAKSSNCSCYFTKYKWY